MKNTSVSVVRFLVCVFMDCVRFLVFVVPAIVFDLVFDVPLFCHPCYWMFVCCFRLISLVDLFGFVVRLLVDVMSVSV